MDYMLLILPALFINQGCCSEIPIFITEPRSHVTFTNNNGAKIDCVAHGQPAPEVTWSRDDGSTVKPLPGILEILENNTLNFPPFQDEAYNRTIHNAIYRCRATNYLGTLVSRRVYIKAIITNKYKRFNLRVNDVYVTRGNTAVLTCDVNPYYVRDYVTVTSWTRNGHVISPDERVSTLPSGRLHIRNVTTEDGYSIYHCVALNTITNASVTSDPASIVVIDAVNSPPSLVTESTNIQVKIGSLVELPCVASGSPYPVYYWYYYSLAQPREIRVMYDKTSRFSRNGGNLVITDATVVDSGVYKCVARNDLGEKSLTMQLTVTAPLSAYITPSNQTVDVGNIATINCSVSGNPVASVTWLKDGLPLVNTSHVMMTSQWLTVYDVKREDKGIYQCVVENNEDGAQSSTILNIGASKPVFFSYFEGDIVHPGSSVSLHCAVSGSPTPEVYWQLDGAPLPLKDNVRTSLNFTDQGDVISYIQLDDVTVEDGGVYVCAAVNEQGSIAHTATLHVYGTPYIRPIPDVTVVAGETMTLRCHVTGYPVSKVTWQKGEEILPSNHRESVRTDGTLVVSDVTGQNEAGVYTCDARNDLNQGMRRNVKVTVIEPPVIDNFRFPDRKQGERVSVTCVVSSGDLPLNITWYKDNQPITADMGIQIQLTGDYASLLSIRSADPSHNGNYTCTATNTAAAASYTASFTVDVPPSWIREPEDQQIVAGSDVIMHCLTSGTPGPKSTWKKATGSEPRDYQGIESTKNNSLFDHMTVLDNGSLVIESVHAEDHGYYLCHSSNGVGSGLSKVVHVSVNVPAQFVTKPHNMTVRVGGNATLRCDTLGDHPLSISWNLNGKSLNHYQDESISLSVWETEGGKNSSVVLTDVTREQAGFYVCNAKNNYGYDVTMVQLIVQDVPEAPSGVKVIQSESRSAVVTWSIPHDNNCPIISYLLEIKNISDGWDERVNVTIDGRLQSVRVDYLHPAVTYEARVLAVNRVGTGPASPTVRITTGEEVPDGPPQNVQVTATSSQELVVKWQPPEFSKRNGEIRGYYVGYKPYNSSGPYLYLSESVVPGFQYQVRITGLHKFTMYSLHVQAYNAIGAGPRSEDVHVMTLEDVPSQAPCEVQATALSAHSVMVLWSPPALHTLHGILQGYKVFYKPVRLDEDENDAMFVSSQKLSAALYGLETYTNYSVEVLAYTRSGEGVRSAPVYIMTQPDVPEAPVSIKAVSAGSDSILVTWTPPAKTNGHLIKYTLAIVDHSAVQPMTMTREVDAERTSHVISDLTKDHEYGVKVCASTVIGQGPYTDTVYVKPRPQGGAQIASFSSTVQLYLESDIILPCQAVGNPTPRISWSFKHEDIVATEHTRILNNGSLYLSDVTMAQAGNYTCRASNIHGHDEITVQLLVQAPPRPPSLMVAIATKSSIQVNWRSGSNGGSKILGYTLYWRRDHGDWEHTTLSDSQRSHTVAPLRCGTKHRLYITAFNKVGESQPSNIVVLSTNGSAPIMPAQSMLIGQLNSTFVLLDLHTWLDGGCPITAFDINYRIWGDTTWTTVESHINPARRMYKVDVHPATWYQVRVTAHNEAGSTECILKFVTPKYTGVTVTPLRVVHTNTQPIHERAQIIIPLVAGIIVTTVFLVGIILWLKRRKEKNNCSEQNASNIRRDLTAETSLMVDLDKRMNTNIEREAHYASAAVPYRYVKSPADPLNNEGDEDVYTNLLLSRSPADGSSDQSQFLEVSPGVSSQYNDEARNSGLYEAVTPHSSTYGEPVARLPYYPHGLILSPRQYHIEEASTSRPPQYTNVPTTATNTMPGSRLSTVSSATNSSTQEELNSAFENAKRRLAVKKPILTPYNTPGGSTPCSSTLYESPYTDLSSPQDSDMSVRNSENSSGIRQFTQSPPEGSVVQYPVFENHFNEQPLSSKPSKYNTHTAVTPCVLHNTTPGGNHENPYSDAIRQASPKRLILARDAAYNQGSSSESSPSTDEPKLYHKNSVYV